MRVNLAVVVGLEGRQAEAEGIMKADLPPDEATAKVTELKRLLAKKQQQRAEKSPPPLTAKHRSKARWR